MVTMNSDRLIDDFLRQVQVAAGGIASDQRVELVSEVREHIASALRAAGRSDEVTVRNVLERLGPPEEITREAAVGNGDQGRAVRGQDLAALVVIGAGFLMPVLGLVTRRLMLGPLEVASLALWAFAVLYVAWRLVTRAPRRGLGAGLEIAAIVMLAVNGFTVPVWGWLVGVILMWVSDAWSRRDKLAVLLVTLILLPFGWSLTTPSHGEDVILRETAMIATALGGLFGGIYLSYRLLQLNRRPTQSADGFSE